MSNGLYIHMVSLGPNTYMYTRKCELDKAKFYTQRKCEKVYTKAENVKFHTPEKSGKKWEISLVNNVCSQEAASF